MGDPSPSRGSATSRPSSRLLINFRKERRFDSYSARLHFCFPWRGGEARGEGGEGRKRKRERRGESAHFSSFFSSLLSYLFWSLLSQDECNAFPRRERGRESVGELEERDTKKRTEGKNPKGGGNDQQQQPPAMKKRSEVGARGSLCPSAPSTKTETEEALLRCFLPSSGKRGKKRGTRTRRRITFVNVERGVLSLFCCLIGE